MKKIVAILTIMIMTVTAGAWTGGGVFALSGDAGFKLANDSCFYVVSEKKPAGKLLKKVQLVDSEFAAAGIPTSEPLEIKYGREKKANDGDIVIKTDEKYKSKKAGSGEVFDVEIGTKITVTAGTEKGVLYGLREVLKKCVTEADGRGLIEPESISESPVSAERVAMLDCGRKYYGVEWICNFIKRASMQRYNAVQLHFSDNEGMRMDSELFPWLTEGIDSYSRDDMKTICRTAKEYGVKIIPDMDSPGHLEFVLSKYENHVKKNPDFSFEFDGKTYDRNSEGFADISNYYMKGGSKSAHNGCTLDVSNPTGRAFVYALFCEYAEFFSSMGSTDFCIGGDELLGWDAATVSGKSYTYLEKWNAMDHWAKYARGECGVKNGTANDAFICYLNDTAKMLEKYGMKSRVWNDEIYVNDSQNVPLDSGIGIINWTNNYAPVSMHEKNGNKLYNANTGWCYYVIRHAVSGGDIMDSTRKRCNAKNIYENWDPKDFANPDKSGLDVADKNYGGGYFCIWSDTPDYKTPEQVWNETEMRMWANSTRLWEGEADGGNYSAFETASKSLGSFPGFAGNCNEKTVLPKATEPSSTISFLDKIIMLFTD